MNPHPKLRDRSLPVPKGRIAAGGLFLLHSGIVFIKLMTLQTVPSPPAIKINSFGNLTKIFSSKYNSRYFKVPRPESRSPEADLGLDKKL